MKKKALLSTFSIVLLIFMVLLSACSTDDAAKVTDITAANSKQETLPYPLELYFSSGAGAWYSRISLNSDGSFSGDYHDSDMGDTGEEYPNGTAYISNFSGEFENIDKINEYTYSLTLKTVTTERPAGERYIEDGVCYFTSSAYGIEGGTEFLLYTPETPIDELPVKVFTPGWPMFSSAPETLSVYALLNVATEDVFFTRPETE